MPDRPRVATLLSSLANYEVAIPSVAGEEAQAAPKVSETEIPPDHTIRNHSRRRLGV